LVRRAAFERVGPFDPALRFSEDTDWLLRFRTAAGSVRPSSSAELPPTAARQRHGRQPGRAGPRAGTDPQAVAGSSAGSGIAWLREASAVSSPSSTANVI
jgi:hypothetical protein